MPAEQNKPAIKLGKGSKPRRAVVRVKNRTIRDRLRELAELPAVGWGVTIGVAFVIVVGALAAWTREQPTVAVGQVMNQTRAVRVAFSTNDEAETERARESARQNTPRVYMRDDTAIEEIRSSLLTLPGAVAGAESIDNVEAGVRQRFGLSAERLEALRGAAGEDGEPTDEWARGVEELVDILGRRPLMDAQTFQAALNQGLASQIELVTPDGQRVMVPRRTSPINIENQSAFEQEARTIVGNARFTGALAELVAHRLTHDVRATFRFDETQTAEAQDRAAEGVLPVRREYAIGQTIFARGDVLDEGRHLLYTNELREFRLHAGAFRVWTRRGAVVGAVIGLTVLLGIYLGSFCPRIVRRSARMGWVAVLLGAAVGVACIGTLIDPRIAALVIPGPLMLVAVMTRIAYDRRTAIVIASVGAVLACLALDRSVATLILSLLGIGAVVGMLGEVRDRREIIRMSITACVVMGVAAVVIGLVDRPLNPESFGAARVQTLSEGVLAAIAGLAVGGVTLFVLPFVERVFDITTGMTLIELRDPKQPLLREMQQRAPGTYNHSLNVASISEAAAESIGADSLLTYVGCLYHDIGKINKPEYFIENQRRGMNRHESLSPAMSLLVIVGHVKDGVEMAREHGLPRPVVHFIEAHHGTTLVEYFYHRAKQKAQGEGEHAEADRLPDEVDYRYPGPKPRTKEVAITMLSDAVESATRTLAEPTPSRIDALVRKIAEARLSDGQFDECDLTLREVRTICDSISKSVASIYHGRIKYASTAETPKQDKPKAPADGADAPDGDAGGATGLIA